MQIVSVTLCDLMPKIYLSVLYIYLTLLFVMLTFSDNIKELKDFCPGSLVEARAEILKIFGWHFGRKDELINSF